MANGQPEKKAKMPKREWMAEWTAEKRRLNCQRDLMAKRQPEKKAKMPKRMDG